MKHELQRRFLLGTVELETREGAALPMLRGHSAVFNSLSEDLGFFREVIRAGAFREAISEHDVVCLRNHNPDCLLAGTVNKSLRLSEDNRGLAMEADPLDTQVARDTLEEIRSGILNGQSFSFIVADGGDSWRSENGQQIREITKFERIYDVGPVVFPAYGATDVSARSLLFESVGLDWDGLCGAFVRHLRKQDLGAGDRDILTRAVAVMNQALGLEGRQEPAGQDGDEVPQTWRLQHLRRHLELDHRA